MKEKKIGSWMGVSLLTAAFALPGALKGDVATNVWQGGNSTGGGWATAANWSLGVPVKGQVVKIDGGASVEMSNDDYATAKLASAFDIQDEGSTLYLPQAATAANTFAPVNLGEGARLFIQGEKDTTLKGLSGFGLITNATAATRKLYIGVAGSTTQWEFGGVIAGKIIVYNLARMRFSGTESTATGGIVVYRNKNSDNGDPVCGILEIARFGKGGDDASSIGKPPASSSSSEASIDIRYSGWLSYFGLGETTDRNFAFRYLTGGEAAYPNTLDAGANGGVTFTGTFELARTAGYAARMVLTGSNTSECVIAGGMKDTGSGGGATHITKKGIGAWRFADNDSRKNVGGIAVEEGTLRFDSIAEVGTVCSLGLATNLQKPYQGAYTADNNREYAYILGGATTNAVFEFTGSAYNTVSTRPMVLTGKGGHLKNGSPVKEGISFSGVSALADGDDVKTLYLSGASPLSSLGEVSDGDGKVGITKLDSGTWLLFGNQTFSGPLNVEAGKLMVGARPYTWFRFTVKGVSNQVFYMQEVGLFNARGERQNLNISAVNPPALYNYAENKGDYLSNSIDYRTLLLGQAVVATTKTIYYWRKESFWISGLFDGTLDNVWRSAVRTDTAKPTADSNWIPIVFRLPEGADVVSACDVVTGAKDNIGQSVTAFSLEGSCDGENWAPLLDKTTEDFSGKIANKWVSNNVSFPSADGKHIPAEGWRFTGHEPAAESQLENVSAVNVAPGATLKAVGAVTLNMLTLDAMRGNGTIDGFDFAKTGVVDVLSADSSEREIRASITFLNCPEGALKRLEGWRVTFDGVRNGATVSVVDDVVTVRRPGTVVVVR